MNPFISAEQLKSQLHKGIVIFDCRFNLMNKTQGAEQYRSGHIPGAIYLNLETQLSSPVQAHGGRHPLPDIEAFTHTLRSAGVNPHTLVVVYDDSRMAYAARAWWLLRYLGHQQVVILDGGFNAWITSGGALDRREPAQKSGTFKANVQTDWTINREQLLQQQAQLTLIDSREAKRYLGLEEPIDPVAGHIPGALNYAWQDVTDEQGFIKDAEQQKIRWQELRDKENLVVYCGSGVTACVNLLSLEISGIKAKLYPGSWSDWCSYL